MHYLIATILCLVSIQHYFVPVMPQKQRKLISACEVSSTFHHIVTYFSQTNQINIGFLKLNHTVPSNQTQIYIHSTFNKKRKLQVYINENYKVILRDGEELVSISGESLIEQEEVPSWVNFILRIRREEVLIQRLGSTSMMITGELDKPFNTSRGLVVSVSSNHRPLDVTFDCQNDCPIFKFNIEAEEEIRKINFQNSFYIILLQKESVNHNTISEFEFFIQMDYFDYKYSYNSQNISQNSNFKIEFILLRNNTSQMTKLTLVANKTVIKSMMMNLSSEELEGSFSITKAKNMNWTFNCDSSWNTGFLTNTSFTTIKSEEGSELNVGEVVAWLVAALSLCGLVILALRMAAHMQPENTEQENDDRIPSESHIDSTLKLQLKQQTSKTPSPATVSYSYIREAGEDSCDVPIDSIKKGSIFLDKETIGNTLYSKSLDGGNGSPSFITAEEHLPSIHVSHEDSEYPLTTILSSNIESMSTDITCLT